MGCFSLSGLSCLSVIEFIQSKQRLISMDNKTNPKTAFVWFGTGRKSWVFEPQISVGSLVFKDTLVHVVVLAAGIKHPATQKALYASQKRETLFPRH